MLDRKSLNPGPLRRAARASGCARSTSRAMKVLVVCRGPVRKEAFEIFDRIGVSEYGMLLSEKDSVVYPRCLAPELRSLRFPSQRASGPRLHGRGPGREARAHRRDHRHRQEPRLHPSLRRLRLHGGGRRLRRPPSRRRAWASWGRRSNVIRQAGAKDEAKKLARSLGNSVIPGVDDVSARALLARARATARASRRSRQRARPLLPAWDDGDLRRGERRGPAPGGLLRDEGARHDRGAAGGRRQGRVRGDLGAVPEQPDPLQAHRRWRRQGPARGGRPGPGAGRGDGRARRGQGGRAGLATGTS